MSFIHHKNKELLQAVSRGNLPQVANLINLYGKELLNSQDTLGTTALHLALKYGHEEITQFLVSQSNINLNLGAYYSDDIGSAYTALDFAIKYNQPVEVVNLLLNSGARTEQPLNLLSILLTGEGIQQDKDIDYKNLESKLFILDTLIQKIPETTYLNDIPLVIGLKEELRHLNNPESKLVLEKLIGIFEKHDTNHYAEKYVGAKDLTHAFPSNHEYETINDITSELFSAEGIVSTSFLFTSFYNSFKDYMNLNIANYSPLQNDVYSEIKASYALAEQGVFNAGLYGQSLNIYQSYENGQTVLLHTGWEEHAVDIILDKTLNLFVVANAGERYESFEPGIRAYNHDAQVKPEDIYKILNNQSQYYLEYDLFYDLKLSDNAEFSKVFPNQEYGNCGLNSLLLANWGLTYINIYKQTSDFEQAKNLSEIWHNDIVEHHKTLVLKNYLEQPYFIDDKPLYDILTTYKSEIDHPEKQEQTHLLLKHLTSDGHFDAFKDFYDQNQSLFSSELTQFIADNDFQNIIKKDDVLKPDDNLIVEVEQKFTQIGMQNITEYAHCATNHAHDLVYKELSQQTDYI